VSVVEFAGAEQENVGHLFDGLGDHHIALGIYGVELSDHVNQSSLLIGLKNGAVYLFSEKGPVASAICPLGRKGLSEHRGFADDLALVSVLQDDMGVGAWSGRPALPVTRRPAFPRPPPSTD